MSVEHVGQGSDRARTDDEASIASPTTWPAGASFLAPFPRPARPPQRAASDRADEAKALSQSDSADDSAEPTCFVLTGPAAMRTAREAAARAAPHGRPHMPSCVPQCRRQSTAMRAGPWRCAHCVCLRSCQLLPRPCSCQPLPCPCVLGEDDYTNRFRLPRSIVRISTMFQPK